MTSVKGSQDLAFLAYPAQICRDAGGREDPIATAYLPSPGLQLPPVKTETFLSCFLRMDTGSCPKFNPHTVLERGKEMQKKSEYG